MKIHMSHYASVVSTSDKKVILSVYAGEVQSRRTSRPRGQRPTLV